MRTVQCALQSMRSDSSGGHDDDPREAVSACDGSRPLLPKTSQYMTTRLAQSVDHRELELGRRRKQKLTDHATDVDGAVTNQFSTVQSTVCLITRKVPLFPAS
jgi:hypothetical protein